jgi:hypothetical protein
MGDKMSEKDKYQAKVIRIKRFRPSSDDELKTKE